MAEFVVNGRRFLVATAHVYFGQAAGPRFERRVNELKGIAIGINQLVRREFPEHPVILAGDLNVSKPDGEEMAALTENGFATDPALASLPSSFNDQNPYDQIMVGPSGAGRLAIGRSGVFKPLEHVFRETDMDEYRVDLARLEAARPGRGDVQSAYRMLRTFQISDHHVKWAEFRLDW
jgi:hypothetical protein